MCGCGCTLPVQYVPYETDFLLVYIDFFINIVDFLNPFVIKQPYFRPIFIQYIYSDGIHVHAKVSCAMFVALLQ